MADIGESPVVSPALRPVSAERSRSHSRSSSFTFNQNGCGSPESIGSFTPSPNPLLAEEVIGHLENSLLRHDYERLLLMLGKHNLVSYADATIGEDNRSSQENGPTEEVKEIVAVRYPSNGFGIDNANALPGGIDRAINGDEQLVDSLDTWAVGAVEKQKDAAGQDEKDLDAVLPSDSREPTTSRSIPTTPSKAGRGHSDFKSHNAEPSVFRDGLQQGEALPPSKGSRNGAANGAATEKQTQPGIEPLSHGARLLPFRSKHRADDQATNCADAKAPKSAERKNLAASSGWLPPIAAKPKVQSQEKKTKPTAMSKRTIRGRIHFQEMETGEGQTPTGGLVEIRKGGGLGYGTVSHSRGSESGSESGSSTTTLKDSGSTKSRPSLKSIFGPAQDRVARETRSSEQASVPLPGWEGIQSERAKSASSSQFDTGSVAESVFESVHEAGAEGGEWQSVQAKDSRETFRRARTDVAIHYDATQGPTCATSVSVGPRAHRSPMTRPPQCTLSNQGRSLSDSNEWAAGGGTNTFLEGGGPKNGDKEKGQLQPILHLLALLNTPDEFTVECAIVALRNQLVSGSSTGRNRKDKRRKNSSITPELFEKDKVAAAEIRAKGLAELVKVLSTGTKQARENAAAVVLYLAKLDKMSEPLSNAGAIPPLVVLLGESTPSPPCSPAVQKSSTCMIRPGSFKAAIRLGLNLPSEPSAMQDESNYDPDTPSPRNSETGFNSPLGQDQAKRRIKVPPHLGEVSSPILLRDTPRGFGRDGKDGAESPGVRVKDESGADPFQVMDSHGSGCRMAARALYYLALHKPNKNQIVTAGGVPILLQLLENDLKSALVLDGIRLLASLAVSSRGREEIVRLEGLPALVEVLEAGIEPGREFATTALLHIAAASGDWREDMVAEGILPILQGSQRKDGTSGFQDKAKMLLDILRDRPRGGGHSPVSKGGQLSRS